MPLPETRITDNRGKKSLFVQNLGRNFTTINSSITDVRVLEKASSTLLVKSSCESFEIRIISSISDGTISECVFVCLRYQRTQIPEKNVGEA